MSFGKKKYHRNKKGPADKWDTRKLDPWHTRSEEGLKA